MDTSNPLFCFAYRCSAPFKQEDENGKLPCYWFAFYLTNLVSQPGLREAAEGSNLQEDSNPAHYDVALDLEDVVEQNFW
jgi:hypothetical protein